jgi:hypothetical protein
MDPDMVRQQEEEEAASRLRGVITGRMPPPPPKRDAFVLRAEPRERFSEAEPAAAAPARERRAPGWGAALRATTYCVFFAGVGLVGGIAIGANLELVSWQSLAFGVAAGFLLGWRSAVGALRKYYAAGIARAYRASLVPALIIIMSLVGGWATILPFAGTAVDAAHTGQLLKPWLGLFIGAAAGFALALPKLRANLRC